MANVRITGLSTQARAFAVDDVIESDGATNASRKISPFDAHGQFRNALAVAGGVAFDGTASSKVQSTLTNQNITTDPFSIEGGLEVPSSNPSAVRGLFSLASSASDGVQAYAVAAWISTSNVFTARIYGAATTDYNEITIALSGWAGKRCRLALTRTGSTVALSINGVAQTVSTASAGTPPTWAGSVTSTYFNVGFLASATPFVGTLSRWSFYNLALSVADVLEIYETNGAVPERYKFGSQVDCITASQNRDFSGAGVGNWTTVIGGASGANVANALDITTTGSGSTASGLRLASGFTDAGRRTYRIRFTHTLISGTTNGLWRFGIAGVSPETTYTPTGTPVSLDTTLSLSGISGAPTLYTNNGNSETVRFDNISILPVGAVVHLPLDDGYSYMFKDQSTNKLHGVMSTTGVSHVIPQNRPHHIRGTTSTNGNQQMWGQVLIPANSQILRVRARAQTNTPTITIGSASGGSQIVASIALSTTWKDLTIALTGGICSADTSIWIGSNSTDVVEVDITAEPLSP